MSYNMISNMAGINSKFKKTDLINALTTFREAHKQEYTDALDVYRQDVIDKLAELSRKAGEQEKFTKFDVAHNLGLTVPVNLDKEYGQLITMFQYVSEEEITLDFSEANRILNNEWEWAAAASVSNSFYSSRK